MNKKVLVVGSSGLLGSTLVKQLKAKNFEVETSDVSDENGIDITKPELISKVFKQTSPDFVINCAAYVNSEAAEDPENHKICEMVNADGPENLLKECLKRDIGLVHVSTDYVFGENRESGYNEDHQPYSPLNKYGETKADGERNITKLMGCLEGSDFYRKDLPVYVVRTSALFGLGATNFIAKIMQYAKEKEYLEVVTDEIVCPTYVKDLSENIIYLIENTPTSGIYHVSGEGSCSRNEFAKEILRLAGIDTPVKPTTLAKFPRKAKIPNISILNNTKLPELRSWEEMLEDFMDNEYQ